MQLKEFIKKIPAPKREAFARNCGTTLNYLRMIAYRAKPCSESLAISIERETNGAVTVEELRPDIAHLWQFIRGTKKKKKAA